MTSMHTACVRLLCSAAFLAAMGLAAVGDSAHGARHRADGPFVVHALTVSGMLVTFASDRPDAPRARVRLTGLARGERVLGIDYRVSRGVLFAVGATGRLYTIDVAKGAATRVGDGPPVAFPSGDLFGIAFNPVTDRVRLVNAAGANLRLHPQTGAQVDADPHVAGVQPDTPLAYDAQDRHAGTRPRIVAAACAYDPKDETITIDFGLDAALGTLVRQGASAGVPPAISFNTGRLSTVGSLGIAPFADAAFDISEVGRRAYAAVTAAGARESRWITIDLDTGKARERGTIAVGEPVVGIAIEP